jgi:hypothetical protein
MLVDYGDFFCRLLRVSPRSKIGKLLKVWIAFTISGAMHSIASWSLPPVPPFTGFYERFMSLFIFFLLQAVGITIEDVVEMVIQKGEGSAKRRQLTRREVTVSRIWTLLWLIMSGRFALECWLKTEQGMLFVPLSIVKWWLTLRKW